MIIDVFDLFRKAANDIKQHSNSAYPAPENLLKTDLAAGALIKIEGINNTLKNVLDSRIAIDSKEKSKEHSGVHRRLDAAWEPSAEVDQTHDEMEVVEPDEARLRIDYFHFLKAFTTSVEKSIDFWKTDAGSKQHHAQLQKITTASEMLLAFLNSINHKDNT